MQKRTTRSALVAASVMGLALTSAACGSSEAGNNAGGDAANDTLHVYHSTAFPDFDPQALAVIGASQAAYFAYDMPFIWVDDELKDYAGELVDNTATKVSFKLKEGLKCLDGHELTPADAARSLERTTRSSSVASYFGPGPFTVEADEATRVVSLSTETPFSGLAYSLSQPISMLVCPSGLDAVEKDPKYLQTHMDGTGPYEMTDFVAGSSIDFTLREEWAWGPEGRTAADGMPGKVKYQISKSPTSMANDLLTNRPAVGLLNGPDAERLRADDSLDHVVSETDWSGPLFNARAGRPTEDRALRQAIGAVLKREDYLQARTGGVGKVVHGAFASSDRCYDESIVFPHDGDLEAAKKILAEGGYTYQGDKLMKDGSQVAVEILALNTFSASGEYVLDQLARLGIKGKLNSLEAVAYAEASAAGTNDIVLMQMPVRNDSAASWAAYASGKASPEGLNRTGFEDDAALWAEASKLTGETECAAWQKVQESVVKEAQFVPLMTSGPEWFVSDNYENSYSYQYALPQYFRKK